LGFVILQVTPNRSGNLNNINIFELCDIEIEVREVRVNQCFADPGFLSRIPNPNIFHPDLGPRVKKDSGSRIPGSASKN